MKTRCQRDTHHLKRPGVTASGVGQIKGLDARLALQQRHHARLHLVFGLWIKRFGQRPLDLFGRHFS